MANNYPFENFPTGSPPAFLWTKDFTSDEDLTEGVATLIASGTAVVTDTVVGGAMRLSGAATTDDSGAEFQEDAAAFALSLGARIRFEARVMFDETTSTDVETQSDFFVGFGALDTSIIASAPTNGLYFRKDDGDANIDVIIRTAGTDALVATPVATIVSDTWYRFGIDVQVDSTTSGKGTVTFYINGTSVGSHTFVSGLPATTTLMAPFVAFQSGNATGTKWVDVDYINMEQTR
jgi:hypothetical protein